MEQDKKSENIQTKIDKIINNIKITKIHVNKAVENLNDASRNIKNAEINLKNPNLQRYKKKLPKICEKYQIRSLDKPQYLIIEVGNTIVFQEY